MTQKAEFQIQANEMNNRPAFPSCRRSVIYFTWRSGMFVFQLLQLLSLAQDH